MNEVEKRSNLLGLIILFVVFTTLGIFLSFFYVIFQTTATDIWANIIAAFVISGVLAAIAWIVKRLMKITNNALSLLVVGIGMVIILYVMWSIWFVVKLDSFVRFGESYGIGDIGTVFSQTREMIFVNPNFMYYLREFNYHGPWTINESPCTGARLWAVWGGETLILLSIPLFAAYAAAGLYIQELGSWVEERLMNYGFTAFEDYELDRIGMGEIEPILEKPLETRNGPMSAVAVCYHKNEATDYIAIYKAHWDKEGALSKGRHIMTVNLGADKIDALDNGLQAKHYPSMAKKVEPVKEEESTALETSADLVETAVVSEDIPTTNSISEAVDVPTPDSDIETPSGLDDLLD